MVSRLTQWTLDVEDPPRMAAFWSAALGYEIAIRKATSSG
jgi:hypothetical protein